MRGAKNAKAASRCGFPPFPKACAEVNIEGKPQRCSIALVPGDTCDCNKVMSTFGPPTKVHLPSFYRADTPLFTGRREIRPVRCDAGRGGWLRLPSAAMPPRGPSWGPPGGLSGCRVGVAGWGLPIRPNPRTMWFLRAVPLLWDSAPPSPSPATGAAPSLAPTPSQPGPARPPWLRN